MVDKLITRILMFSFIVSQMSGCANQDTPHEMMMGRTSSNLKLLCQSLAKNYVISNKLPEKIDDFKAALSNPSSGYVKSSALFDGAGNPFNYSKESEVDASIWSILNFRGEKSKEIRCNLHADRDKLFFTIKYENLFNKSVYEDVESFSTYSE